MSNYWICIGDIHDDPSRLAEIPGLAEARGVIVSGDLTLAKGKSAAQKVLSAIAAYNTNIYAQIGNMDKEEVTDLLDEAGYNIHCNVKELAPELAVMGVGTSNPTPFNTPSETPDEQLGEWVQKTYASASSYPHVVVVLHTPPLNTKCDSIGNGIHVGSAAIRSFIEEEKPELVLCGHIHEARAVDHIGETTIINTGMLSDGGYAKVTFEGGTLSAELLAV